MLSWSSRYLSCNLSPTCRDMLISPAAPYSRANNPGIGAPDEAEMGGCLWDLISDGPVRLEMVEGAATLAGCRTLPSNVWIRADSVSRSTSVGQSILAGSFRCAGGFRGHEACWGPLQVLVLASDLDRGGVVVGMLRLLVHWSGFGERVHVHGFEVNLQSSMCLPHPSRHPCTCAGLEQSLGREDVVQVEDWMTPDASRSFSSPYLVVAPLAFLTSSQALCSQGISKPHTRSLDYTPSCRGETWACRCMTVATGTCLKTGQENTTRSCRASKCLGDSTGSCLVFASGSSLLADVPRCIWILR